jgi:hypothetical protein
MLILAALVVNLLLAAAGAYYARRARLHAKAASLSAMRTAAWLQQLSGPLAEACASMAVAATAATRAADEAATVNFKMDYLDEVLRPRFPHGADEPAPVRKPS